MEKKPVKAPKKEIEKLAEQFDKFDSQVKELTLDRMNETPVQEVEPQTKLSQKEIEKAPRTTLKPKKIIADRQKFNEKFREEWNFNKEYVQFIAEHKEIIGETIELWTHPYGGVGAEYWEVPTNKPVWGPRYLAEQIARCGYHRLKMEDRPTNTSEGMQFYGQIVSDSKVQRLSATPVATSKSLFMGASAGF